MPEEMIRRFTLLPDGTSVPYRPEIHDVPKSGPNKPQSVYERGDRVHLAGIVQEVIHLGGAQFKVRIQLPDNTIWLSDKQLQAAHEAAKAQMRPKETEKDDTEPGESEEEEAKAMKKPPATRHLKGARETK